MEVDEEQLKIIKQKALADGIPIIMDETIESIYKHIKNQNIKAILEIGTAVGYSAICFSKCLAKNGHIDTLERDELRADEAIRNIQKMKLEKHITVFKGDAIELLPTFNKKYDLIFIDAAKGKYPFFLEQALRLISENGVIIADNILYKGYTLSDYNKHKQRTAVRGLRTYLDMLKENKGLKTELINVGDGLTISHKIKK